MSGNPTGSNVVPMPKAPATAAPQMPMPMPGMWGGGGSLPWGPGCCPPGGMDALMKCYCDVQAATAFICSVMVQCVQNNPAVVEAIIAAIEKSGSSVPLIGVTDGSNAQPGQVGEYIEFVTPFSFPTGTNTGVVTAGSLPPGDWDCYLFLGPSVALDTLAVSLAPLPAGFDAPLFAYGTSVTPEFVALAGNMTRGSTTAPSLIAWSVVTAGTTAGTVQIWFQARRRR